MARNLQAKLPPTDSISIFDINKDAAAKLKAEMEGSQAGGAKVHVASTAVEASTDAVSRSPAYHGPTCWMPY